MNQPLPLETIDCPACDAADFAKLAVRADGLEIVRCRGCGLAFLNPRPVAEAIGRMYAAGYYRGDVGKAVGYAAYSPSAAGIKSNPPYIWDMLRQEVRVGGARALDVGCAYGGMVYWLGRAGARATGVDLSGEAVRWGRRKLGLDLREGTLEGLEEPEGSFDLVTMIDVIEHVTDLGGFLARLRVLLRPGGVVVVQTPNFESYRTHGDRHVGLHFSLEHLLYFEAATLDGVMARHGLSPVRPAAVLITIPCDAEAYLASRRASGGRLRRLVRRLPGIEILRWARAKLAAPPPRVYRFDESRVRGATIVGVYRKSAPAAGADKSPSPQTEPTPA